MTEYFRRIYDAKRIEGSADIALDAFEQLSVAWRLTSEQQRTILRLAPQEFERLFKSDARSRPEREIVLRIAIIASIFVDLLTLFPNDNPDDMWIRRPNSADPFLGSSALDYILSGSLDNLLTVHKYLRSKLWT